MNIWDIVIAALLAAALFSAVRRIRRRGSGCGCGCDGCTKGCAEAKNPRKQ